MNPKKRLEKIEKFNADHEVENKYRESLGLEPKTYWQTVDQNEMIGELFEAGILKEWLQANGQTLDKETNQAAWKKIEDAEMKQTADKNVSAEIDFVEMSFRELVQEKPPVLLDKKLNPNYNRWVNKVEAVTHRLNGQALKVTYCSERIKNRYAQLKDEVNTKYTKIMESPEVRFHESAESRLKNAYRA